MPASRARPIPSDPRRKALPLAVQPLRGRARHPAPSLDARDAPARGRRPCAACGYDRCTANLHFHHVDPATKAFAVNMRYGRSLDAYRDEAKKCVLLCANCHGEVEFGLRPSPPAGARYAG